MLFRSYFELTRIAEEFKQAANVHLDAVEHGKGIVFLHRVEEGPASQSYGLQVAQLAGVPANVIRAAKAQLQQLEQGNHQPVTVLQSHPGKPATTAPAPLQNDLFAALPSAVEDRLAGISPDDLSPRQALELLYELKKML